MLFSFFFLNNKKETENLLHDLSLSQLKKASSVKLTIEDQQIWCDNSGSET